MEKERKKIKVSPNATFDRRKAQIDALKPKHSSNNGWWYYEYFKGYLNGAELKRR